MADLSPATPSLAAKKVLTAALESWLDLNTDEDGIAAPIAAALRAAADQVVPEPNDAAKQVFSVAALRHRWQIRDRFLAIAAELEGANG